jgi:hypothetical protein
VLLVLLVEVTTRLRGRKAPSDLAETETSALDEEPGTPELDEPALQPDAHIVNGHEPEVARSRV